MILLWCSHISVEIIHAVFRDERFAKTSHVKKFRSEYVLDILMFGACLPDMEVEADSVWIADRFQAVFLL